MGLHNRARKLLFEDFIERNYKNIDKPIKRELLNISPDDMLKDKLEVKRYNDFQKVLTQSLDVCLIEEENKAYTSLFMSLYDHMKPDFLSLWLFKGDFDLQLIQQGGNVPKYIKNWEASEDQIDIILSKFANDISSPILLKEEEKEDFFGEVESDFIFHPISFQNQLKGFILSSQYNKNTVFSEGYFSSFSKLFSFVNYLSHSKKQGLAKSKSELEYRNSVLNFFQNLLKLEIFDINSFERISRYFKTPQILICKVQGKKLEIKNSFGFKSFRPIQMVVPNGFLKEGLVSGNHLELVNNYISEFEVTGINVFLRNSSFGKRSWVMFVNPHKKTFETNPLISILTDISVYIFENKTNYTEEHPAPVSKDKKNGQK